jgi:hypothetical protein
VRLLGSANGVLGVLGEDETDALGRPFIVACTDPRVTPEEFLGMKSENGTSTTHVLLSLHT